MKVVKKIAWILVIVGALNWGLVGLFSFDLVDYLLSDGLARAVYILVGISAIVALCGGCKKSKAKASEAASSDMPDMSAQNPQM